MVSAIITTKNRLNLLKRAVESVLEQTYQDFELIIVDDNSKDNTRDYCEELMTSHKKIKYICIPEIGSNGANHARNIGIKKASGQYIAFLDDDDEWYPEKLEKIMLKFSREPNLGMIFSATERITSYRNNKITVKRIEKPSKEHLENIKHTILTRNFIEGTSNPVIKKDVLIRVGYFDEKLTDRQEYELWIRIAQCYEIGYIDEVLTKYYFELNSRKQITSGIISFEDSSQYLYLKHKDLFDTLTKKELRDRRYSDYWLLCDRALLKYYKPVYKKYLKKRILLKFKFKDIILYFISFSKAKNILYFNLKMNILRNKNF